MQYSLLTLSLSPSNCCLLPATPIKQPHSLLTLPIHSHKKVNIHLCHNVHSILSSHGSGHAVLTFSSSKSNSKRSLNRLQKRRPAFNMGSNERILRSLYPDRSYARSQDVHSSFVAPPLPNQAFTGPESRYIRLEYQTLFQPSFKWVKGGKLPGILSGSEQGCNAGCSSGGSA